MQNNSQTEVVLAKEVVGGIPILMCFQRDERRKPLILLAHGFGGNKESWIPTLQSLAEEGYYGAALDNKNYGERQEPDFASQVYQGEKLKVHEVRRLIRETAEDVTRLIDHFVTTIPVDQNRIGMCGVSMGGLRPFAP
jgi:cephalosporin-C deacetylase-like acetyl esterase